jgi:hypothetical protein
MAMEWKDDWLTPIEQEGPCKADTTAKTQYYMALILSGHGTEVVAMKSGCKNLNNPSQMKYWRNQLVTLKISTGAEENLVCNTNRRYVNIMAMTKLQSWWTKQKLHHHMKLAHDLSPVITNASSQQGQIQHSTKFCLSHVLLSLMTASGLEVPSGLELNGKTKLHRISMVD